MYLGGMLVASRLLCASAGSFTRGEMAAHRVLADVDELHGKVRDERGGGKWVLTAVAAGWAARQGVAPGDIHLLGHTHTLRLCSAI